MRATISPGRVVIAGGSGFLGQSLARHLTSAGHSVVVLSRRPPPNGASGQHAAWDARSLGDWIQHLDGADALVNLTGRTVDCVKTPDHCAEILESRVGPTELLGRALQELGARPRVWVQMATAHRYGDPPDDVMIDESSPFGTGFAPMVGEAWESAFLRSAPAGTRQVILRTSFVLGREGGALGRLVSLCRFGLGGAIGSGRQGISWIHAADLNRLFSRAIADNSMFGAYLATAPNPVSNAEFMSELRRALGVPIGLPSAAWMVRLGASLLRTDPELALLGRYCVSRRLREEGFEFTYPDLPAALRELFGKAARPVSLKR